MVARRGAAVDSQPLSRGPVMLSDARTVRQEDPHLARLRRCCRNPAAHCRATEQAPGQHGAAQARGPAAGVLVQDPRGLQQAGATELRGAGPWRGHRLGRQPCPGPGTGGAGAGYQSDHRHAQDHPGNQDRRRALAWWQGVVAWRQLPRGAGLLAEAGGGERFRLHPPLRRPTHHCRAGHGGHGDSAPAPGPARRDLRAGRRRRSDRRYRRLREIPAPGNQDHRRRTGRFQLPAGRHGRR